MDENDTIEKVAELMKRHRLSSVPVVTGNGGVSGIISSSDPLGFYESPKRAKAVRAWELCTFKPIEVDAATPAREVAGLMVPPDAPAAGGS